MKTISSGQGLFFVLMFSLINKTYAAEVNTKQIISELESLVGTMNSAGQIYDELMTIGKTRQEYEQKSYQAFTKARVNEIMPQLSDLIEKIKLAQQQGTPITPKMLIAWNRAYKNIIRKYDKLLASYFGKKDRLKHDEFNNKEIGLNTSMNSVLSARNDIKDTIKTLFETAIQKNEPESKEEAADKESKAEQQESTEEEYAVGNLFE